MFKKILAFILVLACVLGLAACKGNDDPPTNNETEDPTKYEQAPELKAYFWGIDHQTIDGVEYYHYMVEVRSDDLYSYPQDGEIVYIEKDKKNVPLTEAENGVIVKTYCINKGLGGGSHYIVSIFSPRMFDTKKTKIRFIGVREYNGQDWTSYNDCVEKYGSDQVWAIYTGLIDVDTRTAAKLDAVANHFNEDIIAIQGDDIYLYYLNANGDVIKDGNTLWKEYTIEGINTEQIPEFWATLEVSFFTNVTDDMKQTSDVESIFKDERFTIVHKEEDGKYYVGIQANEGADINDAPNAIVFNYHGPEFKEKQDGIPDDIIEPSTVITFNK